MNFSLNRRSLFSQPNPAIASLTDGGYVVTWESEFQDGSDWGIYSQRYASSGMRVGQEFLINTVTKDAQTDPAVIALGDGGFVVAWQSRNFGDTENDIFAQRYDSNGDPVGEEFLVNTTLEDFQQRVDLVSLDNGGFVAVWESDEQDGSDNGVYAQVYSADGEKLGNELPVNTYTDRDQGRPALTALASGGFAVFWQSENQDGDEYGVYGQRYASDGSPVGSEFLVNAETDSSQNNPEAVTLADNSLVVTWSSYGQDGDDYGIFARRYGSSGSALGSEFQVNTDTANNQISPSVAALSDGGFVITWRSLDDTGEYNVKGQRFDRDGSALGSEFQVNTFLTADRSDVPVTGLEGGGFVVTWHSLDPMGSDYGTWQRRYDASGNTVTNPQRVNTYTYELEALATTIPGGDEMTITVAAYNTPNAGEADVQATGTDDQETINDAIAQIHNTGKGTVRLLPGTYNISNNILLQSNVELRGSGWRTRLRLVDEASLDNAGIIRTIRVGEAEEGIEVYNTTIADLQIDGNKANQSSSKNKYGIYGNYTDSLMDNLYIHNTSSYGFDPHEVPETGRPTTNLTISNNFIENTGLDGITADKTIDSVVINNFSLNNARHGINIVTDVENTSFLNNVTIGNGGNGITIQNGSRNLEITGNEIRENVRYGIYVDREGGNTITENAIFRNQRGGIQTREASSNIISNNLVGNNSQREDDRYSEIELANEGTIYSTHNTLEANIIYSSLANRARYGIRERSRGDDNNNIINNLVTGAVRDDYSLKGDDTLFVESTANFSAGTPDPDPVTGTNAADWFTGLAGDDTLNGTAGNDFLDGGEGQDNLFGGTDDDFLVGGLANDYLEGNDQDDYLSGGEGNDELHGNAGIDRLEGEAGDDLLEGGSEQDHLYGQGGIDILRGGSGSDYLWGGSENDFLVGNADQDYLNGGSGFDALKGGNADDILDGEDGNDILQGGLGADLLKGGSQDDYLAGDAGEDYLNGGAGADYLDGGADDDSLIGGEGADRLNGGMGNDISAGEAGSDTFIFEIGSGNDTISDFVVAEDQLLISPDFGFSDSSAVLNALVSESPLNNGQLVSTLPLSDQDELTIFHDADLSASNILVETVTDPVTGLNLDIDNNGVADALTDGVLVLRYLFGFQGETLTEGAIAPDAVRTRSTDIEAYLEQIADSFLDIDNNGVGDALTDGVLSLRYLFGFQGETLTEGAIAPDATRTQAVNLDSYLSSLLPAV